MIQALTNDASSASEPAFTGRHVVVTGGGRGIGLAIARALAGAGATVTLLGRDQARLEVAAGEIGAAGFVAADVTDAAGLGRALSDAAARLGGIAILVNNAGAAHSAPFLKTEEAAWRRMLDINLMGAVTASRAVLPGMLEAGHGRIVTVASTAGLKGYAYVAAYCAAKHAVIGFTRALAVETAGSGVTVNAVCPGFTDTDLVAESIARIKEKTGRSDEEALAEMVKHNPMKRLIAPEEVADAVLWLVGPGAGAVTGQAIQVAGGEAM